MLVLPLLSWSGFTRPKTVQDTRQLMDASLKTHCHYELVDMQRFCHLIQFTLIHFGYTRHLVLATDRKWMKHIHDIILVSVKMNLISSVITVMRSVMTLSRLKTVFSLSWGVVLFLKVSALALTLTVLVPSLQNSC